MKKLKSLIFFCLGMFITVTPMTVWAVSDPSFGLKSAGETSGLLSNKLSSSSGISSVLGTLVGILLSMVGVFFFLLILWSGFTWMTAQGSAEKIESAKKMMTSAAIGLVIVLSAYAIANFVFTQFIGGSATTTPDSKCTNKPDQTECGTNMFCKSGKCTEECKIVYATGKCGTPESCGEENHVVQGLCPGGSENVCCVSASDPAYGPSTPISSGNNNEVEKASCTGQSGVCKDKTESCVGNVVSDTDCASSQQCCVNPCYAQNGSCLSASGCEQFEGKVTAITGCDSQNDEICCQYKAY